MSNKISKQEFLSMLKCIRCGSIENLKSYKHKEKKKAPLGARRTLIKTWTGEFPVCQECFKKFKKWKRTRDIYKGILASIFIPFWLLIIIFLFIIVIESTADDPDYRSLILIGIILASSFIFSLIFVGFLSKKHKESTNSISNFIQFPMMGSGMDMIKPENSDKWYLFNQWADLVLKERVLQGTIDPSLLIKKGILKAPVSKFESDKTIKKDIENCPKCGNVVILSKSHICEVCGYEFK